MNLSLYYSQVARNRRRSATEPEVLEESTHGIQMLTEAGAWWQRDRNQARTEPAPEQAQTIGFWMIPQGQTYLKLKILKQYNLGPGFDPEMPFPILPVLQNRKLLQTHMPWLKSILGQSEEEHPEFYDVNSPKHDAAASSLVYNLFYRKWRYFVMRGSTGYYGTNKRDAGSDPLFVTLLRELFAGEGQRPAKIQVDASGLTRLVVLDQEGQRIKAYTREQLDTLLANVPAEAAPEDEGDLQELMRQSLDTDEPWKALYLLAKHVGDIRTLSTINSELLYRVLSPKFMTRYLEFVTDALKDSPKKEGDRIRGLIVGYLRLAAENGEDPPFQLSDYPPELKLPNSLTDSTIQERSYYDLWDLTRRNGDYKYGGMKRIRGRWIYDPTIKGRSQNGARFVTVAPPKPFLDDDGKLTLRFQYQSRPARNTTGMSQVGYIKFIDHEGFMKTASRNIGKAIAKRDIHVLCSCPDFKYRWHWVLAQDNAAPDPVGAGNAPPDKTNPRHVESMCKHLSAISQFVLMRPTASYDKEVRRVIKQSRASVLEPAADKTQDPGAAPTIKPGSAINTNSVTPPDPANPDAGGV